MSYLSNRKFSVQIDQHTSKIIAINLSVPQGGILGPILFNWYVNTLTEMISVSNKNFLFGYTNENVILNSFNPNNIHIKQNIEYDIRKIKTWMEESQLKMKDAKTEFIFIGMSHNSKKNIKQH